jgi:predicted kinase
VADAVTWFVLLIGGSSGVGKTTAAAEIARRLGAAWLMVDDLRLALERSGVPIPDSTRVEEVDAPGGLVAIGEAVSPAIEVVIENHVDQRIPVVIEGDGILPSLLERPSVRARAGGGRVRAVFVHEPDPEALLANLVARGADGWREDLGWYARRSIAHGEWLKREAERRGLPTVAARPLDTLAARIVAAGGLASSDRTAATEENAASEATLVEKLTPRARRIVTLARDEVAPRFRYRWVGPETVILAMLEDGEGVGAAVLTGLGLTAERFASRFPSSRRPEAPAQVTTWAALRLL